MVYNSYVIYETLHGRKINKYAGWSGLVNIMEGNAQAAGMGCMIADGAAGLANALADEGGAAAGEAAAEGGDAAAEGADAADAAEPPCPICFPAGTLVRTKHGPVTIDKIKVGDYVLSRNQKSGKLEYRRVTTLTKPHLDRLLELHIKGERKPLKPTLQHPFWIKRGDKEADWTKAGEMQVGDLVLTTKGKWREVTAIVPLEGQQIVYNFEVEENHDYFVGTAGFLVHNVGPCDPPTGPQTPKIRDSVPDLVDQEEGVNQYAEDTSNPWYRVDPTKSQQGLQNLLDDMQGTSIEDWEEWF